MWKGDLVHRIIRGALESFQMTGHFPALNALSDRLVELMRKEFRDSRDRKYRTGSKVNALFEHEYGVTVLDTEWQRQRDEALKCLNNFFGSQPIQELNRTGPESLVEIDKDQPDQFTLEGVPVYVKLDLAYRRPSGGWVIVDWKTGAGSADDLQAACYAMYVTHAYGVKIEQIEVGESRLVNGTSQIYPIDRGRLESTKERIQASAATMKSLLRDVRQNIAVESDFGVIQDQRICQRCNFQKICPAMAYKYASSTA